MNPFPFLSCFHQLLFFNIYIIKIIINCHEMINYYVCQFWGWWLIKLPFSFIFYVSICDCLRFGSWPFHLKYADIFNHNPFYFSLGGLEEFSDFDFSSRGTNLPSSFVIFTRSTSGDEKQYLGHFSIKFLKVWIFLV